MWWFYDHIAVQNGLAPGVDLFFTAMWSPGGAIAVKNRGAARLVGLG